MESFSELSNQLKDLGYDLKQYLAEDEDSLYEIFREVVDSGSQFPYECNSREEFYRQYSIPCQKSMCAILEMRSLEVFISGPIFLGDQEKHTRKCSVYD